MSVTSQDLFGSSSMISDAPRPLADRLRPANLDEVVGQDHLLGEDGPIRRMVDQGRLTSMILWGTPGCGKTTIARLLADQTDLAFEPLSAVFSGVADLRKVLTVLVIEESAVRGLVCLSMRSIVLTRHNRTVFCPMSKTAPLF